MLKHLIIILLLLLCIVPVFAANTTCPVCPPQKIIYVTVTVTVPVPVYQQTGSIPTVNPTPTITTEPILTGYFTKNPELFIYGILFLILLIGMIFMWRRNRNKGKPPTSIEELDLFEDEPPKKYVQISTKSEPKNKLFIKKSIPDNIQKNQPKPEREQESKKPKKPKSLLEQDFEF